MEPVIFAWPILENTGGFGRLLVKRKREKRFGSTGDTNRLWS